MASAQTHSALLADASLWDEPSPDLVAVNNLVGPGSVATQTEAAASLCAIGTRSPVTIAFILDKSLPEAHRPRLKLIGRRTNQNEIVEDIKKIPNRGRLVPAAIERAPKPS